MRLLPLCLELEGMLLLAAGEAADLTGKTVVLEQYLWL
jgi:hypothetical protein